jgi:hypothetical protein
LEVRRIQLVVDAFFAYRKWCHRAFRDRFYSIKNPMSIPASAVFKTRTNGDQPSSLPIRGLLPPLKATLVEGFSAQWKIRWYHQLRMRWTPDR